MGIDDLWKLIETSKYLKQRIGHVYIKRNFLENKI